MSFSKPWRTLRGPDDVEKRLPILDVYLRTAKGSFVREVFVVDSGADISLGPRRLCELVGLTWQEGKMIELHGISQRQECAVQATIHPLNIYVREARCRLTIPFCFAADDAPLLLGRDGFFDAFRVTLDKQHLVTEFDLLETVTEGR